MSNPLPTSPFMASPFMASPFMERLIRFLVPYFIVVTPDLEAARAEVLETLASYGARTRSEMLNAIQIIAFGLSALETLGEAKTDEMSPSMRLRFRGCANNLNPPARRMSKCSPDARPVTCPISSNQSPNRSTMSRKPW
jgi:hypothetical protein